MSLEEPEERSVLVSPHNIVDVHGTFGPGDLDEDEDLEFVSFLKLVVLNSFVAAYGLIQVSLFMLILPKQCERLFPQDEAVGLAGMLGLAGATQLICPVAGLFSDRMASPFGRRRPFIIVGTIIALLALCVLWYLSENSTLDDSGEIYAGLDSSSAKDDRDMFIVAFGVLNLSLNVCFASYAGLIPDFVGQSQLGEASGIMAVMTSSGSLLGVWLIGFMGFEPFSLYGTSLVICCSLTLLAIKETPLEESPEPIACGDVFHVYVESLQDEPDFFWVWVSRLLYYMGISVQVFMQYFIRDIVHATPEEAKTNTALVSIVTLISSSIVAIPCGILSDKIGRRPLVYVSCAGMATVYIGWSFSTRMVEILLWSCLFGIANGTYLSVDYALACDTIPDKEKHAAQALGVWGVAAFLGTTIGPVLSGPILYLVGMTSKPDVYSRQGYSALLGIGAVFVIGSSLALQNLSNSKK
mmetsp:Transcript_6487/g.10230  ORF Transcript_6487/g.10230 Transcript_6487/m.10230 type:complete len:468 (+) Transcript_6487:529-1932(+)